MSNLYVIPGDITRAATVDAIATLVNPEGEWHGGVDRAIRHVAGIKYHTQIIEAHPQSNLRNGQVVVAKGSRAEHAGTFNNVVFVVDALVSPLNELVYQALQAAKREGYTSIALPLMRTGVMLGVVEPDVKSVVQQMKLGIDRFIKEDNVDMEIYIIVYQDSEAVRMLAESMKLLES